MCGIVGALAFGKLSKRDEKIRQRLMRYLTTELLLETEERGKDATGAAVLFTDGNYAGIKRGEESSKFLAKFGTSKERYGSLLEIWRKHEHPAKVFIGHCRKGTIGDKEDNENNHPIKVRNIVGVHNGVIRNDDEIEKHLGCKRDGKVDSEIIFRMFDYFTNSGKEPFTMDMLEKLIARLTGAFAVLAFNADNMNQLPMFRDGRPLEMILIKDLSLMIIVSELKFWSRVHFRYERMLEYGEIKLPSLLDMEIDKEVFKDDSAVIFDLTLRCNKDTKIEDLGEFKKIPRNNKIWTTTAALNRSNTAGASTYNGGQKMAESEEEKKKAEEEAKKKAEEESKKKEEKNKTEDTGSEQDEGEGEKRRVFDKITKRYKIQKVANPKKIEKDESKVIPIDSVGDEKKEKTTATFEEDSPGEETSPDKLELDDRTDYTPEDKQDTKVNSGSEDEAIDAEFTEVKEVDMSVVAPELQAAAEESYDKQPDAQRGYGDIENLLDDINVRDEDTANQLGMKLIANRVAKVQWIRGFIAGWKTLMAKTIDEKDSEKVKIREKHIAGLKSLVVILATYFARTKSEGKRKSKKADESLTAIATDHLSKRAGFDMERLNAIFNMHETGKIREAKTVINTVSRNVGGKDK